MSAVAFEHVCAAATTIAQAVIRTPTVLSRLLSEMSGATLFLKMENLQYTASFKERGALNKLSSLTAAQRRAGVIAMSAGNHALGVAYHATRLGIQATIVMPRDTPFVKVSHTRDLGADVVLFGDGLAEAACHAEDIRRDRDLEFVHPYDDAAIIAGQGTVALEMLEDVPDLDVLVVPVGGGGLISGCAIAAKAMKPAIRVIGVEAELYPSMLQAIRGETPAAGGLTIAEGIAVKTPGTLTRAIIAELVDDLVTVPEAAIEEAVHRLVEIEKTVAEGAGAAALAAVFADRERYANQRVGVVISGGNIDSRLLASILMRGLVRDGRLVWFRVMVSDAPGALARVANLIGEGGGNIVEISHQRLFHNVPIKMAELDVVVETRTRQHVQQLLESLAAGGFPATLLGEPDGA
jgi:threonine dehydratase